MSVLVSSTNAFERVFVKAVSYTFSKTLDINYCNTLGKCTEGYLANLVKTWADLNNESYTVKYNQDKDEVPYSFFLNLSFSGETINTYQMLKSLECIYYNIELCTIETVRELTEFEKRSVEILKNAIEEIKTMIVEEIPEYKEAKWSL